MDFALEHIMILSFPCARVKAGHRRQMLHADHAMSIRPQDLAASRASADMLNPHSMRDSDIRTLMQDLQIVLQPDASIGQVLTTVI